MTAAQKKKAPAYETQQRRSPHAENVLQDELYAEVRQGSNKVATWVPESQIGMYKGLRLSPHQFVDPDDVEELSGGDIYPHEKDFGVFVKVVDVNNRVVMGSPPCVLMWTTKENRAARQAELLKQSASIAPRTGQGARESVQEEIMTLEDLRGKSD